MMTNYSELKNLLERLINKLYFTMGGSNDGNSSIWLEEQNKQLTAITTNNGYVIVSKNGSIENCKTIDEVESIFLVYFTKGDSSLQNIIKKQFNSQ